MRRDEQEAALRAWAHYDCGPLGGGHCSKSWSKAERDAGVPTHYRHGITGESIRGLVNRFKAWVNASLARTQLLSTAQSSSGQVFDEGAVAPNRDGTGAQSFEQCEATEERWDGADLD